MNVRFTLGICLIAFGMCACASTPKVVEAPIHAATAEDCDSVYEEMLAISLVKQLDSNKPYSKEELRGGLIVMDVIYALSGKRDSFYQFCTTHLNPNQTSCMSKAKSFEEMDKCKEQTQEGLRGNSIFL